MAINTSKVLVGGIAAGVVLNVIDMGSMALMLGERMKAESNAFKPGLGDAMQTMSGGWQWASCRPVSGSPTRPSGS